MRIQGLTKRDEISRSRISRDTRTFGEKALETLRSAPGIGGVYLTLVGGIVSYPALFDIGLAVGVAFACIPLTGRPDLPFRRRKSSGGIDYNDQPPGSRKPGKARGIFLLGNRIDDGAEIWAANEDMRTHIFQVGSTGAGKTESLIGVVYNALVQASGVAYLDGKADVKLWAQFFSMCRQMGREDDIRVLNYMTGNADTTLRRADKLSNTTNPFTTGNAEANTQLLVDLMDASPSGGDMWKGRAISWASSLMPPLHELRDKGYLHLHVGLIRDWAPPLKYFELMEHQGISERSRDGMRAFLSTVPGYDPKKPPEKQSSSFLDQYGFQTMQFTRILGSLADTYGHIYATTAGEVIYKDIVLNRRLLLVMLPALEKSRPELANLGKINVAAMKSMMGTELGGKLEGSKRDLLDARSTNAPMPFVAIFDEFGYFMPDGAALMWAQARGLGFCLIAAGQDLQAFFRTSREETMAIVANCNIKIVGKLEDPDATFDMVRKIAGEAFVAENEGFDLQLEGLSGYKPRQGVRVTKADRVTLQDLKDQVEGDIHMFVKSTIIRGRTFYAGPKIAKEFRVNHFLKVLPPDADTIRARRLDVRHLIQRLVTQPLSAIKIEADSLSGLVVAAASESSERYSRKQMGCERGVSLLMQLLHGAPDLAVSTVEGETGAGGGGGLAHKPQAEQESVAGLASAPDDVHPAEPNLAPAVASEATPVGETFDGGNLAAVNVFASSKKTTLAEEMAAIAAAAMPLAKGIFDLSAVGSSRSSSGSTEAGSLDRAETEVKLNAIALGLGASPVEARATAAGLVDAAISGTEYPLPPKPAATPDKQESMESVMDELKELLSQPGGIS